MSGMWTKLEKKIKN